MKKIILIIFCVLLNSISYSQTKIGNRQSGITPSTQLELSSNNKGLRLPNVSLKSINDKTTVANPIPGMQVFNIENSGTNSEKVYKNQVYLYNGTNWELLIDKTALSTLGVPTLYGIGKTTMARSMGNSVAPQPNFDNRDPVIGIAGGIEPVKAGYYQFYLKLEIEVVLKANDNPFVRTPANGISLILPKNNQVLSKHVMGYSGILYLAGKNAIATNPSAIVKSQDIGFAFGGNRSAESNDKILSAEIIWLYLGDL